MIEWLTLITGAIVAIATAVLAYITWRHVRLTRETLKATYKPEIIVRLLRGNLYVHNEYFADYEIILSIKNVGTGVARKRDGRRTRSPDMHRSTLQLWTRLQRLHRRLPCTKKGVH